MNPTVYSETGIFIAFIRSNGETDNAHFYTPRDCVRWLLVFGDDILRILVLRTG